MPHKSKRRSYPASPGHPGKPLVGGPLVRSPNRPPKPGVKRPKRGR